jgi:hypothetical protein
MMLTGEGIATVRKNYHRYLDRSHIDAQISVSHLQKMPWAAA